MKDVMAWYDAIASSYDELYGEEQRYKHRIVLERIAQKLSKRYLNTTILVDLGCGTGLFIETLAKGLDTSKHNLIAHLYYIGLDISFNLLEYARMRLKLLPYPADVIAGDIYHIPLRSNSSDVMLAITVLRCHDPLNAVLKEIKRVGSSESVVLYTVLCNDFTEAPRLSVSKMDKTLNLSNREILIISKNTTLPDERG